MIRLLIRPAILWGWLALFLIGCNGTNDAPSPTPIMGTAVSPTIPLSPTAPPASPTGGALFERTNIYLIAPEDNGQSGELVGCGDSLIAVEVVIEPTPAPLTAALEALLAVSDQYYGQSGLYNALYQSDLQVDSVTIQNGQAAIALSGSLMLGGTCDAPRVQGQLEATALQFTTVDTVMITLNGRPLAEALSER